MGGRNSAKDRNSRILAVGIAADMVKQALTMMIKVV
jgi:hypothetical protein